MGVNLSALVSGEPVGLQDLRGRTIAVDAYNTIYAFLSIIRDRFTGEPLRDSQGRVTSHLSGLFYRTTNLLENGINPVFVFDGKPPALKQKVSDMRSAVKKEAEARLAEARKNGDVEGVRRYAQATSRLTPDMVADSKKLLEYMGIPVVQAPSEGEAQAAHMTNRGLAWASGSQDADSLLFGAERMVKNLAVTGRRKVARKEDYVEIRPELIELEGVLSKLGISREQMVMIGMLIGTDYNPGGVKGIGPKTALKLVKGKGIEIFDAVEWEFKADPREIFDFFMNPPVSDDAAIECAPDMGKLRELMTGFDFSAERVDKNIERLKKIGPYGCSQKAEGLGKWLK